MATSICLTGAVRRSRRPSVAPAGAVSLQVELVLDGGDARRFARDAFRSRGRGGAPDVTTERDRAVVGRDGQAPDPLWLVQAIKLFIARPSDRCRQPVGCLRGTLLGGWCGTMSTRQVICFSCDADVPFQGLCEEPRSTLSGRARPGRSHPAANDSCRNPRGPSIHLLDASVKDVSHTPLGEDVAGM